MATVFGALISNDNEMLDQARSSLQDVAGLDAVTRAALVIGNFEMMKSQLTAVLDAITAAVATKSSS